LEEISSTEVEYVQHLICPPVGNGLIKQLKPTKALFPQCLQRVLSGDESKG